MQIIFDQEVHMQIISDQKVDIQIISDQEVDIQIFFDQEVDMQIISDQEVDMQIISDQKVHMQIISPIAHHLLHTSSMHLPSSGWNSHRKHFFNLLSQFPLTYSFQVFCVHIITTSCDTVPNSL